MEARRSGRLRSACVAALLSAPRAAALTASENVTTSRPLTIVDTSRAPYGSRVAAVLVPCLVALAIALLLLLSMGVAKLREKRRTEGGYRPRQLDPARGREPPVELHVSSLSDMAARAERLV